MIDYAGNVLGAIDLIVQERMKDLKFDKTIVCTVVENKGEGIYVVNDGASDFEAVADILSYPVGFQVNVLVPQGDFNNQKTITGRYIKKGNEIENVRYMTPFDNCLDVTGNIIGNIGEFSLLANGNIAALNLWKKDLEGQDIAGYDYLGLSADFFAALSEFNPISGNYGLELVIEGTEKNSDNLLRAYSFKLDSSDMYGNPYLFETYFNQQKVFKIDQFKSIKSIYLKFYQDSNFTYEYELNGEIVAENVPITTGEGPLEDALNNNLKVKNFYMFFGYALDKLATDTVLLITTGSEKYNHTEDTEANERNLMVKWVRRDGNTAYVMEEDKLDPSMRVHWYRYDETFTEDPIAGDNWEELPNSWSKLKYENIPLRVREKGEEKFKVIITKGDIDETTTLKEEVGLVKKIESNELTFTSAVPIIDQDAVDRLTGLKISYVNDNYQGKYRIYGENKELKNGSEGIITRALAPSLELHEVPVEIAKEDIVIWYVPKNATMIVLAETAETAEIDDSNPDYYIVKKTGAFPTELHYKIKNLYLETNVNNTINCLLYRNGNGITYEASTTMTFGTTGTAGTDYTFVIEPEGSNGIYTAKSGNKLTFVARLYDYNDEPIEWQNESIRWEWAIDAKHAFTGIEKSKDEKYTIGSSVTLIPDDVTYNGDISTPKVDYPEWAERYSYNAIKATATANTEYKTKTPKMNENGEYLDASGAIIKPDKNGKIDTSKIIWEDGTVSQKVEMTAYYSIPVRAEPEYYISGATSLWYDNAGTNPVYAKDKYEIFGIKGDIKPVWEVIYLDDSAVSYYPQIVSLKKDEYTLKPKTMYIQDVPETVAIKCYDNSDKNNFLWIQPLIIRQDKYGSTLLNQWDGSLTIDEKNGTILSTMVGAGVKNSDNTFSGVLMGDVQNAADMNATGMGIYGFNHGEQSFNFSVDGTAFIGKSGRGRIMFDGNNGTITSQGFEVAKQGMKIDLNTGKLESKNIGGSITMTPEDANNLFVIKDKNNDTIMHVSNEKYYLQSSGYIGNDIGMKINLANGIIESINSGGIIKIDPTDVNRLFTIDHRKAKTDGSGYDETTLMKIGVDSYYLQSLNFDNSKNGMKINLVDGTIDARGSDGSVKINPNSSSSIFTLKYKNDSTEKTLMQAGGGSYYLQSANYASNSAGMKINLSNGSVDAAKFKLSSDGKITATGGTIGSCIIRDTYISSSNGSSWKINSDGSANFSGVTITGGHFEFGNFKVDSGGNLTAKNAYFEGSGSFTGTITATAGTIGGCTISNGVLKVAEANITGTLDVSKIRYGSHSGYGTYVYIASHGYTNSYTFTVPEAGETVTIPSIYVAFSGGQGYNIMAFT